MREKNKGQATIIVLTMMVAAVGIGLFITKGIQTDLQMTKVQEESARAFSAAEAGIESALFSWNPDPNPYDYSLETGNVSVLSSNLGEGDQFFEFPDLVQNGDFSAIWLVAHNEDGSMDESNPYGGSRVWVCWEGNAALELILFYKEVTTGNYKTARWAFDPDAARRAENNFSVPTSTSNGCPSLDMDLRGLLVFPGGTPLFVIAKAYYADTPLGAQARGGGVNFPSQGKLVTSTGAVVAGESKTVSRRLQVLQTWDTPPLIFFEPVFSGGGIQAL